MKKIISISSIVFSSLLLVSCNSSNSNNSGQKSSIQSSKKVQKVGVLTNPKALATEPSGHNAVSLVALSEPERQSWFSEGVKKTWERECVTPKLKSFSKKDQGVLAFVAGVNGIWGVQCSGGENYFALLPIDSTDKLQFVSCEGDIAKANLCRKF